MTTSASFLLGLAVAFALANWWAVARDARWLELVAKPATLLSLIGVAATLLAEDDTRRGWFLVALVLSLAGDVFLMLRRDTTFLLGLVAFLLGHLAYVAGFGVDDVWPKVAIVAAVSVVVGAPVVRRVDASMRVPIVAYMVVITLMVSAADEVVAIAGAALFYVSDACIAYNRFVFAEPKRAVAVAIMVLYHLGQAGLVLSLLA